MDRLAKHERVNQLLIHYKKLLTEKQQTILSYYYEDDYSLAEIADILSITRNGVHDHVKKAIEKMEEWDNVLTLTKLHTQRSQWVEALEKTTLTQKQKEILTQLKKVI